MTNEQKKAEHEARVKALNEANLQTAAAQQAGPTPSQEEIDLISLGLMHPDQKTSHETKAPKPPAAERAPEPTPTTTRRSS